MHTKPHPTDYAPYHTMPAFDEGITAYMEGHHDNPHDGVAAQAWDRGSEYAMRVVRFSECSSLPEVSRASHYS